VSIEHTKGAGAYVDEATCITNLGTR